MQVQCSVCSTLNDAQQANQLGHVVCGGCQITLMYSFGAQSVKCAVCNHVTPVAPRPHGGAPHMQHHPQHPPQQQQQHQNYPTPPQPHHHHQPPPRQAPHYHQPHMQHQQHGQQPGGSTQNSAVMSSSKPPMQAVLVENPPSLDESGNEVQNMLLGVTPKQERN